jgi:Cu(I)/Ag(I) efflux system membrane fusion protein
MRRPDRRILTIGLLLLIGCRVGSDEGEDSVSRADAPERHQAMPTERVIEQMEESVLQSRSPVHLTVEQERALGITYATVQRETLTRTIRTVGSIQAPETGIAEITPKIEGFVERLFVASTGEAVRRGQPLLTMYSPALVVAQEELLTARRLLARLDSTAGDSWKMAQDMLDAARRRLGYWDITEDQIQAVEQAGEITKTLTLMSPVSGIVLEKDVLEGQRVVPGGRLYRIADLGTVWVEGELFEQDLQFVRDGAQSHIEVAAYPGEHLMGTVSFVSPTVDVQSRTNRVRVTVPNPDLRLKPGMFATLFFDVTVAEDELAVPLDAVIVTGERNLVFVRDSEGALLPREVGLGARAAGRVQILEGLEEGEVIVASANFLVDAESRLTGTGGSMPGMQHAGHGSAVEPEEGAADSAGETGMEEHDHD